VTAAVAQLMGLPIDTDSDQAVEAADPDAAVVERVRGGERAAFDQLVRRHQRGIFYLTLRYLKSDADAKDVTQRAFVRAYESLGSFRGQSRFRSWLYRIAINLSLNHLRDHRREVASEIREDAMVSEPVGAGDLIAGERAAALREAVTRLPPKQRLVIELRVFDELPFREVAELAGCSENAAKVNFHHAVKRLRALITGDATDPDQETR
jgi:RNA polymerase sigma-70 factor, ECF subfamily